MTRPLKHVKVYLGMCTGCMTIKKIATQKGGTVCKDCNLTLEVCGWYEEPKEEEATGV